MLSRNYISDNLPNFQKCKRFLIGFSGGVDSTVLLNLINDIKTELHVEILAIHVNHNLQNDSDVFEKFCIKECERLGIKLIIKKLNISKKEISDYGLESAARNGRYNIFKEIMSENDVIITAHHEDDQAETFILQLLRGAGVEGLSSMPIVKDLNNGYLFRPLLNMSKNLILKYAEDKKLNWVEDKTNNNININRNYIRHNVMPILKKNWPSTSSVISRSAKHQAEYYKLSEELAKIDINDCLDFNNSLNIKKLKLLSLIRQKNVIRYWLKSRKLPSLSTEQIQSVINDVLYSKNNFKAKYKSKELEIYIFQDTLCVINN